MSTVIQDPIQARELRERRRRLGIDKYDEVWDGAYVMNAAPRDFHQNLVKELTIILGLVVDWKGLGQSRPGVNISDRRADWTKNYRIPDLAVFLSGTRAVNHDTHWVGGPEFAIEIASPDEDVWEKTSFYGQIGTGELLIIDPAEPALCLLRLEGTELREAGRSTLENSAALASSKLPLAWQIAQAEGRPQLLVRHSGGESWSIPL